MTDRPKHGEDTLPRSGDGFADADLKDKIGGSLKQIYDEVVNEPVPDDFLKLLAKADECGD